MSQASSAEFGPRGDFKRTAVLTALGIVFGTSPLYVFQAISKAIGGHFDKAAVMGSLSLIIWTLVLIVAVKYASVVMRADNRGEGGILALASLTRVSWRGRNYYLSDHGLDRCGADLRRRADYAGCLGIKRGRGPECRE